MKYRNKQIKAAGKHQGGALLLEAMVGILIFSLGALAMVGMYGTAVKTSTESKYRSDANLLANQVIGRMWGSDRNPAALQAAFASPGGATYTNWLGAAGQPGTVKGDLPGGGATVVFGALGIVTVTVTWQTPGVAEAHSHIVTTQVRCRVTDKAGACI